MCTNCEISFGCSFCCLASTNRNVWSFLGWNQNCFQFKCALQQTIVNTLTQICLLTSVKSDIMILNLCTTELAHLVFIIFLKKSKWFGSDIHGLQCVLVCVSGYAYIRVLWCGEGSDVMWMFCIQSETEITSVDEQHLNVSNEICDFLHIQTTANRAKHLSVLWSCFGVQWKCCYVRISH